MAKGIQIGSLTQEEYVQLTDKDGIISSLEVSGDISSIGNVAFSYARTEGKYDKALSSKVAKVLEHSNGSIAVGAAVVSGNCAAAIGGRLDYSSDGTLTSVNAPSALGNCSFAVGKTAAAYSYDSMAFGTGIASADHATAFSASKAYGETAVAIAGGTAYGDYSFAVGQQTSAFGQYGIALAGGSTLSGSSIAALNAISKKEFSIALLDAETSAKHSLAIGQSSKTTVPAGLPTDEAMYETAIGQNCTANAKFSFALGQNITTNGSHSIAVGEDSVTHGKYSIACGYSNETSGNYAIALGNDVTAKGEGSIAIGKNCLTQADWQIALGIQAAGALNHTSSFVWSGVGNWKSTNGPQTFSIYPKDDAAGFFIGKKSLSAILSDYVLKNDIKDCLTAFKEEELNQKQTLARVYAALSSLYLKLS